MAVDKDRVAESSRELSLWRLKAFDDREVVSQSQLYISRAVDHLLEQRLERDLQISQVSILQGVDELAEVDLDVTFNQIKQCYVLPERPKVWNGDVCTLER